MQYLDFEQPIADLEKKIKELSELSIADDDVLSPEIKRLEKRVDELRKSIFTNLTRWQRVQPATVIIVMIKPLWVDLLRLTVNQL